MQKQYIVWRNGCVKKQSLTNFVVVIYPLFTVLIVIICLIIYPAPLYTKNKNGVDAAGLIYIGSVNFSSYLETAGDRLN